MELTINPQVITTLSSRKVVDSDTTEVFIPSRGRSMLGHTNFSLMYENISDGEMKIVSYTWRGKYMHKRGYGYTIEDHWLFSGTSGEPYRPKKMKMY